MSPPGGVAFPTLLTTKTYNFSDLPLVIGNMFAFMILKSDGKSYPRMLTAWGRRGGESVQRRAGGERCDVRIGVEAVNLLRGGFFPDFEK